MTNQINGEFTHLHVHTEYSILDGIANIPKLVAEAQKQGAHRAGNYRPRRDERSNRFLHRMQGKAESNPSSAARPT